MPRLIKNLPERRIYISLTKNQPVGGVEERGVSECRSMRGFKPIIQEMSIDIQVVSTIY